MTDIQVLCNIIDPTIDWSTKDLGHISSLKVNINTSRRDLLLQAIRSTYWPEAVPAKMIVNTLDNRQRRARTILNDFVRQPLKGQKFLDFGCGKGDCVHIAKEMGAEAVGFDSKPHDEDWKDQNGKFTTDIEEVIKNGPYDIILFYDVFDHMIGSSMDKIIWSLRKATRPRTAIYARCHPYSSRHGSHLYETLNKAYAHLFLSPDEIKELGGTAEKTHEIINPELVYPAMLEKLGFTVISTHPATIQPEPIIQTFVPFLMPMWYTKCKISDPVQVTKIMSIQFLDYVMRVNM